MGDRCDLIDQIARNFVGDAVDPDAARQVNWGFADYDDIAFANSDEG
jgi:hypothetical protein